MTMGPKPKAEATRFWKLVDKTGECWLWLGTRTLGGYGRFRRSNPRRMDLAHRVSWELTNGPVPEGLWVLHTCDTRDCVRPEHLFLGTAQDNSTDMLDKARSKRRLTDAQVAEIRQSTESARRTAAAYGVTRGYVSRLRRREKRVR